MKVLCIKWQVKAVACWNQQWKGGQTHQKIHTSAPSYPTWNSCDWFRSGVPAKVSMIHLVITSASEATCNACNALRLSDPTSRRWWNHHNWDRSRYASVRKNTFFNSYKQMLLHWLWEKEKMKSTSYPNLPGIWKELKRRLQLPNQLQKQSPHFFAILVFQGFSSVSKRLSQLGSICFFKGTTWSQRPCKVAHHWQFGLASCTPEGSLTASQLRLAGASMSQKGACLVLGFSACLKIWYDDKYSVWVSLVYMLSHAIWVKIINSSEISKQFNIHIPKLPVLIAAIPLSTSPPRDSTILPAAPYSRSLSKRHRSSSGQAPDRSLIVCFQQIWHHYCDVVRRRAWQN